MTRADPNPRVSWFLRAIILFELVVLVASGIGLVFLPGLVRPSWPWDIPPFNAAFVGAIYLASVPSLASLASAGRWSPARFVLPLLLGFTCFGLIASLLNLPVFHLARVTTWIWFLIFTLVPLASALHLWLYRRWPAPGAQRTAAAFRLVLLAAGALLVGYAVAQFLAPGPASAFWPWPVDAFHARLYSGAFLAAGLGAWFTAGAPTRLEFRLQSFNVLLWGLLAILGLITVDFGVQRVQWLRWGTCLWLAGFGLLALLGFAMLLQTLRWKNDR